MNQSKVEAVTVRSRILKKEMPMLVYLPKAYSMEAPLPVLYFLHGRNEQEDVMFQMNIAATADELIENGEMKPLIIVCPRMDNSRGINSAAICTEEVPGRGNANKVINLGRYEDYFMQEIIPFTETHFHTTKKRKERYVGGISAGGYAALHNTFRHQEMFSKVGGHMPALELTLDDDDKAYYQEEGVWDKYDPIYIVGHNDIPDDIEVYLDAGDRDEGGFYEGCAILHNLLVKKGFPSQNQVFSGNHSSEYIQGNIEKYLRFYGGC